MQIIQDVKLDFNDVMLRPMTSSLNSRSEVNLERSFKFVHSPKTWTGVPIIAANMDTVGTIAMARVLQKHKILTALHKFVTIEEIAMNISLGHLDPKYLVFSTGIRKQDFDRLEQFRTHTGGSTFSSVNVSNEIDIICIDVPNGYIPDFFAGCKKIREMFPEHIIMAGNIVTGDVAERLIQDCGVDVVKVGIGPGEACFFQGTKIKTASGYKNIEQISIGETVLCHDGSYQIVTDVHTKITDEIVTINDNIKCTPDHKFLVIDEIDLNKVNDSNYLDFAKWVTAKELNATHYLIEIKD